MKAILIISCAGLLISANLLAQTALPFKAVTTQHQIKLNNVDLHYHTTVGVMPIYNKDHQLMTTMSYIAYTADTNDKKRPVSFVWAGGPGASSLADNFLLSGPKIIDLSSKKTDPKLISNANTWLSFTDLVYIDMGGTGFGRTNQKLLKSVYTPAGDAKTFSIFIENYLQRYNKINASIYLVGESYGGFRAPLVANNLLKQSIPIKGIILLSPLLSNNYQESEYGNNITYPLAMPTFIRTALYFNKLATPLQKNSEKTIRDGTKWAAEKYPYYLLMGDALNSQQESELVSTLSQYTGLSKTTIQNNHYRISTHIFMKELLRDKNRTLDMLDARHADIKINHDYGLYVFHIGSLMSDWITLYPTVMHYVFQDLGVKTSEQYINYFDPNKMGWANGKMSQVISILHDDLIINSKTNVFVGVGFYDTDIPYFATETAINQLLLPKGLRKNIRLYHYDAGHMFYTDSKVKSLFFSDIKNFYAK